MRSPLPKVLHEIAGQPLLFHVLGRVREAAPGSPVAIVVGHAREQVEAAVKAAPELEGMSIRFIHQPEQRGTGDAARVVMESPWGMERVREKAPILVLPGDTPLIPSGLISEMLEPLGRSTALRLLTCELADPTGYGRVVRRGKSGPVLRIVEQRDANEREKAVREVAASTYLFQAGFLAAGLPRLSSRNAQGEFYLTDLIAQAVRGGKGIDVLKWSSAEDLRGVNDLWELAEAHRIMNERVLRHWAKEGVRIIDPRNTTVHVGVELAPGVVVHPGAILKGRTQVSQGATLGPGVVLKNVRVGEEANVKAGTVGDDSVIGPRAQVGPYAHLRPESVVGAEAKIGNFVELKKARVGASTSVAHLSYLGDAEVGERVNIGCGFVTCNFDGRVIDGQRKHRSVIEDDVFVGSDCQVVAPIRIGKGAYIASGSTVTEDVEGDALVIARTRQVVKPGYARKLRGGGR